MLRPLPDMEIFLAPGHEVPSRFRDQQWDFKGNSIDDGLPGTALVHLKQFSIFGMIPRLKDSELHKYGM